MKIVEKLEQELKKLPGIGNKTARRLVYFLLTHKSVSKNLGKILLEIEQRVSKCKVCGNLSLKDICQICEDPTRDKSTICIVESIHHIELIEKTNVYKGVYHVLPNLISLIRGKNLDEKNIEKLIERSNYAQEVIIATSPTIEGEITARFIYNVIKDKTRVTRIAFGVPVGGSLEYVDEVTLAQAILGRKESEKKPQFKSAVKTGS